MGLVRNYESWENRPRHPLTGAPADYFWEHRDGKRTPHWYAGHLKRNDPALSWFSVPEVARMLGKTPRRIRQLIALGADRGGLNASRIGRIFYIKGSDIPPLVAGRTDIAPLPQEKSA